MKFLGLGQILFLGLGLGKFQVKNPQPRSKSAPRSIPDVKRLVQKLIQQDFDTAALRKRFQAFIDNHFDVWGKFGTPLSVSLIF